MAPRVVGTLLVRDEADIVELNLRHHLDQGLRPIIVTDNGSVDGTREIVERFVASRDVVLIDEPGRDYRQYAWVTRMARMAATKFDAEWVINMDVDEFWLPTDRNERLIDVFARIGPEVDVVVVAPHDLKATGWCNGEERHWSRRLVWRDSSGLNEKGFGRPPKVCHRGFGEIQVHQGNHSVEAGRPLVRSCDIPIALLHVPIRSYRQYARKIENGGEAYSRNPEFDERTGWHWREEYRRLKDGELPASYRTRQLGIVGLLRGVAKGSLHRDTWLRERAKELG